MLGRSLTSICSDHVSSRSHQRSRTKADTRWATIVVPDRKYDTQTALLVGFARVFFNKIDVF